MTDVSDVSDRPRRSIGDVLAVLEGEFPDISISKIRYLESQGLVAPARARSGYRQFDDDDIAMLRWVLRQQRDHFLPLRVIRASRPSVSGTADCSLPIRKSTTAFMDP